LKAQGYQAKLTDKARSIVASASWDPVYGARPVKRMIQKRILDPLSLEILAGKFSPGDKIKIDDRNGGIVFLKG
jgi:ATP-dependent Clp protease ATP-binding subunit ClpA